MKPIRIFRHISCEGPGYFATFLENYNIPYELVCIDAGEAPPAQIDDVSGLVFMGGPMSANDNLPWIHQELALIRQAASNNLPMLGHCLGGQLISKALNGTISTNPVKEIGWLPVQKIANPQADDWLNGLSEENTLFHWHGETFSIPNGGTPILKSKHCTHQGFIMGNTLALQCHVEITADMVREWADLYQGELAHPTDTIQSREDMVLNLDKKIEDLQKVADALYWRWLRSILP